MEQYDGSGFFHVCTDGTVLPWMFKDQQDFIAGMNRIGICVVLSGAEILVFSLMDNHVHFLMYGKISRCKKFIDRYKTLTGKWISNKYGISSHMKELPASIIPLKTEEEILETAAYIDRNSVMAGFKGLPSEYPWGSSCLMFRKGQTESRNLRCLTKYSANQLREMIRTRVPLPEDWKIYENGMLDPACFTGYRKMEKMFVSPVRYLYFLSRKLEGKINTTLIDGQKTFMPDKELRPVVEDIAQKFFNTKNIKTLNVKSRLSIARKLRKDYASTVKQIARMVYLDPDALKDFI